MCHKPADAYNSRTLSGRELRLLRHLLEVDFIGHEQLLAQLSGVLCKSVDNDGSLELFVQSGPLASINGLLVEATYPDSDGVNINILLHIRNYKLWFLEIYKDDNSTITIKPTEAQELSFFTAHPFGKIGPETN